IPRTSRRTLTPPGAGRVVVAAVVIGVVLLLVLGAVGAYWLYSSSPPPETTRPVSSESRREDSRPSPPPTTHKAPTPHKADFANAVEARLTKGGAATQKAGGQTPEDVDCFRFDATADGLVTVRETIAPGDKPKTRLTAYDDTHKPIEAHNPGSNAPGEL